MCAMQGQVDEQQPALFAGEGRFVSAAHRAFKGDAATQEEPQRFRLAPTFFQHRANGAERLRRYDTPHRKRIT